LTAAFHKPEYLWCPLCEEKHDAAPCPSPEEIQEGIAKCRGKWLGGSPKNRRIDIPKLGEGQVM
jgi:hypothetical protein